MNQVWVGIAEFNNAMGSTVVAVAENATTARVLLFKKWRNAVGKDFESNVKNFEQLHDWNGARVSQVSVNSAHIWEQLL